MSNYSGIAEYRQAGAIGLEHFELGKDVTKYKSERVGCLTLDNFASMHLPPPKRSFLGVAPPRIDLLSVDAEGQDALILEGAEELLSKLATAGMMLLFILFAACVGASSGCLCDDTCAGHSDYRFLASDGFCDDGGPGSLYSHCALGTDVSHAAARTLY